VRRYRVYQALEGETGARLIASGAGNPAWWEHQEFHGWPLGYFMVEVPW
jgi:hypothetical protein